MRLHSAIRWYQIRAALTVFWYRFVGACGCGFAVCVSGLLRPTGGKSGLMHPEVAEFKRHIAACFAVSVRRDTRMAQRKRPTLYQLKSMYYEARSSGQGV